MGRGGEQAPGLRGRCRCDVGEVAGGGRKWYSRRDCSWWDEAENSHQDREVGVDVMLSRLPEAEETVTSTETRDVE